MKRAPGLILATFAVLIFASACSRPSASEPAPEPAPEPTTQSQGPVVWPEWAFPTRPVDITYRFDDGTPDTSERLATLPDRVVALKEGKVYVTWFVRPDGVYRRDPLGGKDAALLRYLPAEPKHDMVWSQTSGDAQVWFRLQQGENCGATERGESMPKPCWNLYILNRGEVHYFRFARASGVVQAGVLSPAKPLTSFRKETNNPGIPARPQADDFDRWTAAAGVWADDKARPYQESTVAEFERHLPDLSGFGRQLGAARVFTAWGEWTDQALLEVESPYTWAWRRCGGKQCRYSLAAGEAPLVLVETRHEGQSDTVITGFMPDRKGNLQSVWGFEPKLLDTTGEVERGSGGALTIRRVLDDPAGHTETRVYRTVPANDKLPGHVELVSTDLTPAAGALKYPETPLDVLMAAFVAKYYGETDELPGYFASAEAAAGFAAKELSPSPYGYRGLHSFGLGSLVPYTGESWGDTTPAVQLTPGPLGADGRSGFMLGVAYYEGGAEIWGQVQFVQQDGLWKIAELILEGDKFVY